MDLLSDTPTASLMPKPYVLVFRKFVLKRTNAENRRTIKQFCRAKTVHMSKKSVIAVNLILNH